MDEYHELAEIDLPFRIFPVPLLPRTRQDSNQRVCVCACVCICP